MPRTLWRLLARWHHHRPREGRGDVDEALWVFQESSSEELLAGKPGGGGGGGGGGVHKARDQVKEKQKKKFEDNKGS